MSDGDSSSLRVLLERVGQGEESANTALLEHAYERLRILARAIFRKEFPRLAKIHDTGSILDEAVLRLYQALSKVQPATPRDFFGLASMHIRWVLLDLARRQQGEAAAKAMNGTAEPIDPGGEPIEQAIWTEFHRYVEQLPADEREVVDLHFYQGFTLAETAELMGTSKSTLTRQWVRVQMRLKNALPWWDGEW